MHDANRLLTPAEVSDYLSVSVATLAHWRARGEGPRSYKIGARVRYRLFDLNRWIAQQSTGAVL